MAEFNYDDTDEPDLETVRSIVADIANAGKPTPPTEAERDQWRAWREQQEWLAEHRQREAERQQAEIAAVERAEAIHRESVARSERQRKINDELREQSRRQTRDRSLTEILLHQIDQRNYRAAFSKSAQYAASRQRLTKALDDVIALKYPPAPEPLPEPEMPEPDPPIGQGWPKIKSWW